MVTTSLTDCQDDIISHRFAVRTTVFLQDQGLQVSGLIPPRRPNYSDARTVSISFQLHHLLQNPYTSQYQEKTGVGGIKKEGRTNGAFSWIVLLTHLASTELLRLLSSVPGTQLNSYQANSPDQLLCAMFSFIVTQVFGAAVRGNKGDLPHVFA